MRRLGNSGQVSPQIVLIGVIVIALLAALVVTTMVVKPMFSKTPTDTTQNTNQRENEKKKEKKDEGGGHGGGSGEGEAESGNIFKIEGIVVNPAATGGSRYLATTIGFEMPDEESLDKFKSEEIKLRDALIRILSSKTVTELADAKSRELIRKQILKIANQICQPAEAEAMYFVDFVLQ